MIWLFMIILVICITVIICVFLQNADNLNIYDVRCAFEKIEKRMIRIENFIIEHIEEKAGGIDE